MIFIHVSNMKTVSNSFKFFVDTSIREKDGIGIKMYKPLIYIYSNSQKKKKLIWL